MPFEDDLGLALREAVDASPPPRLDLLATGAAQRGQRRKRRRTVLASVASVAVLAGAGAVALNQGPANGPTGITVATGPTTATQSTTATPPPTATPSPGSSPGATTAVPSSQVLKLFKSKLPDGFQTSHPVNLDLTEPEPGVRAGVAISNGSGKGTASITITRGKSGPWLAPGCGTTTTVSHCTDTPLPGGAELMLWLPDRVPNGTQVWNATLKRSDGITLTVESGNVPDQGSGDTDVYPNPPLLTGAQLTALAEDPVWLPVMASIPAP